MVLSELLWQIAYSYTYELRPHLDLLLQMLLLEDSWQNHRISNSLNGKIDLLKYGKWEYLDIKYVHHHVKNTYIIIFYKKFRFLADFRLFFIFWDHFCESSRTVENFLDQKVRGEVS